MSDEVIPASAVASESASASESIPAATPIEPTSVAEPGSSTPPPVVTKGVFSYDEAKALSVSAQKAFEANEPFVLPDAVDAKPTSDTETTNVKSTVLPDVKSEPADSDVTAKVENGDGKPAVVEDAKVVDDNGAVTQDKIAKVAEALGITPEAAEKLISDQLKSEEVVAEAARIKAIEKIESDHQLRIEREAEAAIKNALEARKQVIGQEVWSDMFNDFVENNPDIVDPDRPGDYEAKRLAQERAFQDQTSYDYDERYAEYNRRTNNELDRDLRRHPIDSKDKIVESFKSSRSQAISEVNAAIDEAAVSKFKYVDPATIKAAVLNLARPNTQEAMNMMQILENAASRAVQTVGSQLAAARKELSDYISTEVPNIRAAAREEAKAEFVKTYGDASANNVSVPKGTETVSRAGKRDINQDVAAEFPGMFGRR